MPAGFKSNVEVHAWGGAGGGGYTSAGGGGGYAKGYLTISSGDIVEIGVGAGGTKSAGGSSSIGGKGGISLDAAWQGGDSADGQDPDYDRDMGPGGGGGGATVVKINGVISLVAAGGGGGGGPPEEFGRGYDGIPAVNGLLTEYRSGSTKGASSGRGATTGGGGGAGYYGGIGGVSRGDDQAPGDGGRGGQNYGLNTEGGSGVNPGGRTAEYYPGAPVGTAGYQQSGGDGYITLIFTPSFNTKVKVGGVWKNVSKASVKVNGSWKDIVQAWVKVAGVWKPIATDNLIAISNATVIENNVIAPLVSPTQVTLPVNTPTAAEPSLVQNVPTVIQPAPSNQIIGGVSTNTFTFAANSVYVVPAGVTSIMFDVIGSASTNLYTRYPELSGQTPVTGNVTNSATTFDQFIILLNAFIQTQDATSLNGWWTVTPAFTTGYENTELYGASVFISKDTSPALDVTEGIDSYNSTTIRNNGYTYERGSLTYSGNADFGDGIPRLVRGYNFSYTQGSGLNTFFKSVKKTVTPGEGITITVSQTGNTVVSGSFGTLTSPGCNNFNGEYIAGAAQIRDRSYCGMLAENGTWQSTSSTTSTYQWNVLFPVTGSYMFSAAFDESGTISVDGTTVVNLSVSTSTNRTRPTNVTANVTAGIHRVTMSASSISLADQNPRGQGALVIYNNNNIIWHSRSYPSTINGLVKISY